MRTEEFEVVTKKVKYIADDGTVFSFKYECEEYEQRLAQNEYKDTLSNMRSFLIEPPNYDEYFSFEAFVVTNERDLEAVNSFYAGEWQEVKYHCDTFPQVVCTVASEGGDTYVSGDIDDFLKDYEDFVEHTKQHAANLLAAATDA